jgi:3-hydroxybutyryl-CoA dehydratase
VPSPPPAASGFDPAVLAQHGFPTISYDRLEVGETFRSDDRLIRPQDVEAYAFAIDDHDPWFFGPGPFGPPIAHPTLLANQALFLRHTRYVVPAGLHARMIFEFLEPVPLGSRVRTTGTVVDKYVRRDKPYMVTEYETRSEDGSLHTRGRFVQMLFRDEQAPPHGSAPRPEPEPPTRDPAIASAEGRGGTLVVGDRLEGAPHTISQAQLDTYSGVRPRSIHTDEEWAQAKGFPTTIAQGMMSTAYISALLTGSVGEGFVAGGRMDTRFLRPVLRGDTITASATVLGFRSDGERTRIEFDVEARNQRGETTLTGTASALSR